MFTKPLSVNLIRDWTQYIYNYLCTILKNIPIDSNQLTRSLDRTRSTVSTLRKAQVNKIRISMLRRTNVSSWSVNIFLLRRSGLTDDSWHRIFVDRERTLPKLWNCIYLTTYTYNCKIVRKQNTINNTFKNHIIVYQLGIWLIRKHR